MTPDIRLGRLFGIEIGFNWSLIFIFALIAWMLATTILPVDAPGSPALVYWIVAGAGAVLFYICLLAHELSHALVARRNGVKVAGIAFGLAAATVGSPLTSDLFAWLTFVNIALGLFNLVPAFPLDGGRLLSS